MPDLDNLGAAAIQVLSCADPRQKAAFSRRSAQAWREGKLAQIFPYLPSVSPARPDYPRLLKPQDMPKRRSGSNLGALLHAVTHIEFNAIDLAWDMVARFGADMPRAFCDDWVSVGDDEARHFTMMQDRLQAYDMTYGDLPAHDGLWQSALDTRHDLKARLAIVPLVLEARGLDVTPMMIKRFEKAADEKSAEALTTIYIEEVSHVAAGKKWFSYLCDRDNCPPVETYHHLVRRYFKGYVKPPFNEDARARAGLTAEFYKPLAPEGS
ncbi:ferritin-like domain-containing protein [Paremcibacter congregatus]|uniref:Rhamnosyltransferase n=1 Tax=Paremcibacter congregatus TaxID=2043170 RepID=A0A2G4YMU4_9PROT|nr:ferritin-like domain-containing protein [Paremcibacter congregatus]PHZ83613.1 rhamnosyltransferase [Paremcibacter congregatus]QDE27313.1 ferritin-like domain-containing protein [Paremcibacter congregatus]